MELLPPKPAKRKRLALSDAAKSAICAYKRDHPSAKPEDVATEIQRRFQLDEAPARRTIYDVLKESEKWLSIEDPSEKTLSHKPVQHPQLEEALFMWIKAKEAHGLPLSDYLVAEQAKSFGAQLNIKDFAYSQGWIDKLKRRSGVKGYITHGEAGSVDSEAAIKGIKNVRTLLGGYQDRDIYNMDVTAFWKFPFSNCYSRIMRSQPIAIGRRTALKSPGTYKCIPIESGARARAERTEDRSACPSQIQCAKLPGEPNPTNENSLMATNWKTALSRPTVIVCSFCRIGIYRFLSHFVFIMTHPGITE